MRRRVWGSGVIVAVWIAVALSLPLSLVASCVAPDGGSGESLGPPGARHWYWSYHGTDGATLAVGTVVQLTLENRLVWGRSGAPDIFDEAGGGDEQAALSVLDAAYADIIDDAWWAAYAGAPRCDGSESSGFVAVRFVPADGSPPDNPRAFAGAEIRLCSANAARLGMERLEALVADLAARLDALRGPPQICAPPRCTAP